MPLLHRIVQIGVIPVGPRSLATARFIAAIDATHYCCQFDGFRQRQGPVWREAVSAYAVEQPQLHGIPQDPSRSVSPEVK